MIEYVQLCVKDSSGIGKPYTFLFYAPINEDNPEQPGDINFAKFKEMPDDLKLLEAQKFQEFCYKQCLKMCYYLQKVRKIEVLQMGVEFLRDENDNVWFSSAKEIQIRRVVLTQLIESFNPENI